MEGLFFYFFFFFLFYFVEMSLDFAMRMIMININSGTNTRLPRNYICKCFFQEELELGTNFLPTQVLRQVSHTPVPHVHLPYIHYYI